MRRDNIVTQKVSNKETEAINAEARKNTAEGQFVILSENKKKISIDIEKIEKDILAKESIKDDTEKQIKENKEYLSEVQKSIKEYSSVFEKVKNEIEKEKQNRKDFFELLNDEQEKYDKKIIELELIYQSKNLELKKEIDILDALIGEKNNVLIDLDSAIVQKEEKIIWLNDKLEKIKKEISEFDKLFLSKEEHISKLDDRTNNQETLIEQKRLIIEQLKKDFIELDKNLIEINTKITEKQKELDALDQKVFSAVNREEVLNQKEAFIKSKFIRAGIKWEN